VNAPILEVRGVSKTFQRVGKPSVEALGRIDLAFAAGEFVSIVGASGSGKSTLIRIIDGLMPSTTGEVCVEGKRVTAPGADRAVVFQQDSLLPWKSVMDNVMYGLRIARVAHARARAKAQHFIDLAGLTGFETHYPHQLSGGMRQRVNVARALAVSPKILLLDEPFAALDSQTREIMQTELLKIWNAEQKTVVMITHQIEEAVFLSDRVVVFSARPGTVKASITIDLPRPRTLAMKRTGAFTGHVDRIWKLIEDEVRSAMGLAALS
jgi:NitT/TauT family transport system ATP-binding protein